jgi:hypothetical protein
VFEGFGGGQTTVARPQNHVYQLLFGLVKD